MLRKASLFFLKFILPFGLWLYLFNPFLKGQSYISADSFSIYSSFKFFLDNMRLGVFPLWNPFENWGEPHLRHIGEFNPAWFLIPILQAAGLPFYAAFLTVIFGYYLAGLFGFYALTLRVIQERSLAYVAFLLLMFSSLGMHIFAQLTHLLLFVPAVWFFYFLCDFVQRWRPSSFIGMVFTLMMAASVYLPFYFLITLVCVVFLYLVFYGREAMGIFRGFKTFVRAHPVLAVLAVPAIIMGVLPQLLTWAAFKSEVISLIRPATLTFSEVRRSGLPLEELMRDFSLFSLAMHSLKIGLVERFPILYSLKDMYNEAQRIFYIPLTAHLVVVMSAFMRFNRKIVFLFLLNFLLFILVIVETAPVYEFLFTHSPFFRMFRNVFLLIPFLTGAYLLLAMEQMRLLADVFKRGGKEGWAAVIVILALHAGFYFFLRAQPNILPSMYVTLGLSFCLSVAYFLFFNLKIISHPRSRLWTHPRALGGLGVILAALMIFIQPVDVLHRYVEDIRLRFASPVISASLREDSARPSFVFERPVTDRYRFDSMPPEEVYHWYCWYKIALKDSPGFISLFYGFPPKWSFELVKALQENDYREYVKNKFLLYDAVRVVDENTFRFEDLAVSLKKQANQAYVFLSPGHQRRDFTGLNASLENLPERAQPALKTSKEFQILQFNVNAIKIMANFAEDKFLVYNDSYHPSWRVNINGRPADLYRANYAFKGIWLPSGPNIIQFYFNVSGGAGIFNLCLLSSFGVLGLLLYLLWDERRRERVSVEPVI